jgi:nucleoside-diphosphate-sugar epimerase
VWQERLAQRAADGGQLALTVLRPGIVWGAGNERTAELGPRLGDIQVLVGPLGELPLTYVENCADAFVAALEADAAVGQTFNVADGHRVTRLRHSRAQRRSARARGWDLPIPYGVAWAAVRIVHAVAQHVFGPRMKLPSIAVPVRFRARFLGVRVEPTRLAAATGWRPRWSYDEAMARVAAQREQP